MSDIVKDLTNYRIKGIEKAEVEFYEQLTKTLDNYAETGSEYTKILEQIIVQNRLMDFELVRLTSSNNNRSLDL